VSTKVMRVPSDVQQEATQIAALRRQQPAQVLAEAWNEYMTNHREEFAADLEKAAAVLRNGSLDDLAELASRNVEARARVSAQRARGDKTP
jgi:hypothetical protein